VALYKTEAIVLRTRNLGEADRIVTLYTRDRGKVEGVARGSRRAKSRLTGATQLFTYGRYLMFSGRSLDTVSQAEIVESFAGLREDLTKMAYASYIAELLDVTVELGEPSEDLFELVHGALAAVDRGLPPDLVARWFELRLMDLLGYRPQLEACVSCRTGVEEGHFSAGEGGLLCPGCRVKDPTALPVGRSAVQWMKRLLVTDASRLGVMRPSERDSRVLETVGRAYIDFRLPRPLKSVGFLASINELA